MIRETERLIIRKANLEDAPFFLKLLNQPSYIKNIRDSLVRSKDSARKFIHDFYLSSYDKHGHGLYLLEDKFSSSPVGVCGPLKRDDLDFPDMGFALLEEFQGQGLIQEGGKAILEYCRLELNMSLMGAITTRDNHLSRQSLLKLGFYFKEIIQINISDKDFELYIKKLE